MRGTPVADDDAGFTLAHDAGDDTFGAGASLSRSMLLFSLGFLPWETHGRIVPLREHLRQPLAKTVELVSTVPRKSKSSQNFPRGLRDTHQVLQSLCLARRQSMAASNCWTSAGEDR
jgi:hypothetical protein